jgi:trans-2,3-dihydro-3-hydroxyanthranilate isomerase
MARFRFVTADVFTDHPFGGNPLAVLPDARGLATGQMQAIAREFNLSETVFVLPPENPAHARRLRIFTPKSEIPFAGHPTVGTAIVLAALGEIPLAGETTPIVFEEGAGPVPVMIRSKGGRPVFAALEAPQAPEIRPAAPPAAIAAAIGLDPADLEAGSGLPAAVSCGLPFTIARLCDLEALARARLDHAAWRSGLGGSWADHLLLIADGREEGVDLRARMFAPGAGVDEDPATGSAAAALGGWMGLRAGWGDGVHRLVVHQGVEMGRPSRLEVEVERRDGALVAVRVGGGAVVMMEGTIAVPDGD